MNRDRALAFTTNGKSKGPIALKIICKILLLADFIQNIAIFL